MQHNLSGELYFPGKTEVEGHVAPLRKVKISVSYNHHRDYKAVLTAALRGK